MGSRDSILANIKHNKPELLPLPEIDFGVFEDTLDLVEEFTKKVEIVGGNVFNLGSIEEVLKQVKTLFPDTSHNYSTVEGTANFNTISLETLQRPHDLNDLDVLVLESSVAVSENGAVWISNNQLPVRVLPFITKHLVLVLNKSCLVPNLHHAYKALNGIDNDFGVFISGPSKTADIEQSLVIGAHGALSLSVFLID
ncbi:LutC/YkgG family protein [Snuella lapsa]